MPPIPKPAKTPPKKPAKGKKPWVKPANWEQMTRERWLKNHPQPLFPSVEVTPREQRQAMQSSRQQVTSTYNAVPLPSQVSYLQPFADASARTSQMGQNAVAYLQGAQQNAQNLSGAFQGALTGGIQAGQASVAAQGGSAAGSGAIPTAGASLIPAAGVGSSFTNYLNAIQPAVGASVNEANAAINTRMGQAAGEYQQATAQRRAEIQEAIQKVYASSLDTLQGSKVAANKAKVTEYLALGKTAYQAAQAKTSAARVGETKRHNTATETAAANKLRIDTAYKQATLDAKRTSAAAKGIDLKPAYDTLFVETPSKPGKNGAGTGPQGQVGATYEIVETYLDEYGDVDPDRTVTKKPYIAYGEKVPKAQTYKAADGGTWKRTVVRAKLDKGKPGAKGASTRKATPASWDRAVALLKNKYPGHITASWLKANFPPRPAGT